MTGREKLRALADGYTPYGAPEVASWGIPLETLTYLREIADEIDGEFDWALRVPVSVEGHEIG